MEADPKEMLLSRIIEAPLERVWEAWTDPKHLAQWWGPKDFTNPVCEIELWPGGKIRIDMTAPDGIRYPMGGHFQEIEKPHRLVFISTALEDEKGEPQLQVLNTITFEDVDGKTKLTVQAQALKAVGPAKQALEGQTVGWSQSLDRLAFLLKKEDIFLGGKYPNQFINFNAQLMLKVNPYLNFNGNTEEAFNFYKSVFGGEFLSLQRFKDIPGGPEMSAEVQEKIMHIALPLGKDTVLMATDALESMGQKLVVGNNFYLNLYPESKEEADQLFAALSKGGQVEMPLQDTFWGAYYGALKDKFGVQWMINFEKKQ